MPRFSLSAHLRRALRIFSLAMLFPGASAWAADLTLTWTDNSDNETGFKIERSMDGVSFGEVATTGANVTSYADTGLTVGQQYHYRVAAYNGAGDSGFSNVATATPSVDQPVNTQPTISAIPDQSIPEDTDSGPIPFTIGDAETPVGDLSLSATSSNLTLVPNANIVFGGSGSNRTVTITPAANQTGTTTITVTVSDGELSASDSFVITVTQAPLPATFDYSRPSGGILSLTSHDVGVVGVSGSTLYDSLNGTLTVTAGGTDIWNTADGFRFVAHQITGDFVVFARIDALDNPHQYAKAGVMIRESLDPESIHALANLNPSGSANFVTRTVTGGTSSAVSASVSAPAWVRLERVGNTISAFHSINGSTWSQLGQQTIAFSSTVHVGLAATAHTTSDTITAVYSGYDFQTIIPPPANTAPTISNITDKTTAENTPTNPIAFTVSDLETAAGSLTVSGSSSNAALVPNSAIVFSGTGSNRAVTITPAAGQTGTATITVSVSDGNLSASDSFVLTVEGVNDAPTLSALTNTTIDEDTSTEAIAFTIGDPETDAASLTVSGSSSNTTLVPNADIVFGGSGINRTVTITPAADQSGTTTITVTVSDGSLTASDSFVLTVNAVNDDPTISNLANLSIDQDSNTGAIAFTVGDVETAAGSLTLSGSSANPTLVPDASIVFGGSGSNRTVTVTPAAGQSGTATITVSVSDGSATVSSSFVLTVTATVVVEPVTVSVIAPLEGATFTLGATISGEALTSDIARTVTVEFFHGSTRINTERQTPYTFNWTPNAAGAYAIKAIVTDTDGAQTESAPISISVVAPTPFEVSLTSPADGATFTSGDVITVTGEASDPERTVRVELLVDGAKIGEDAASPYAILWSGASAGSHSLQLRAVDADGQSVLSGVVSITVNDPPLAVELIEPSSDLVVESGATVLLEASTSDTTRTSSVEFYADGASIGTSSTSPYRVSWKAETAGTYSVYAEAVDKGGKKAQSRAASVTVKEPVVATEIALVNPTPESELTVGGTITLEASVTANAANVGRVEYIINGIKVGQSNAAPYLVDWVPVEPGQFTIVARAIVPGGANQEAEPVTVTVNVSSDPLAVASGVYRGKFKRVKSVADEGDITLSAEAASDEAGSFAIHVDSYGIFTFLGFETDSSTGFVGTGLKVGPDGSFEIPGKALGLQDEAGSPQAPPSFVRGRITDKGISGVFEGTDLLMEGGLVDPAGPTASVAGSYELQGLRTSDTRVRVIVAPDGIAIAVLMSDGAISGEEVAIVLVDEQAYLNSPALKLEVVIDSVEDSAIGTVTQANGEFASLMGLRSDIAPERRLENISTRGTITAGSGVMISGFVISGTEPKIVLIRAIGPGLGQFGITSHMADPVLELVGEAGVITSNARWILGNFGSVIESASDRVGAFALDENSLDAALLVTVAPGRYSAVVRDAAGGGGDALIEMYDASESFVPGNDLVNLSTRGAVGNGRNLIGGFVVTGNVPKRVLIRGVGPGLAQFGVADTLSAARLVLTQRVDGANVRIAENTGWSGNPNPEAIQAAAESAGAFILETGSADSALLIWLEPGVFTAEVQPGTTGATGTALIEVYQTD